MDFRTACKNTVPHHRQTVHCFTPAAGSAGTGFPLDEELELLPGELSATLAEGVARLGTKLPFEQAATELAFFWSVELDETTIRRHTQAAGAAYVPSKRLKSSGWSASDQQRQQEPRSNT